MTTIWTPQHVALIGLEFDAAPLIDDHEVVRVVPGRDIWDPWPVRNRDGSQAILSGRKPWIGLSAAAVGHPGGRHDRARLWLFSDGPGGWVDHGPVFPDDHPSFGSREWAGCAYLDSDNAITVVYTAAGSNGEATPTFMQRIVGVSGRLRVDGGSIAADGWSDHREVLRADGVWYQPAVEESGRPGFIKAFRDPFYFQNPASGLDHLLFTGSVPNAQTDFNGAIGSAVLDGGEWKLRPPLVTADGVNNELERPHLVVHDGLYYLFFSTQGRTFRPPLTGPNGLYGFVAGSMDGPYAPLNGSGLVFGNPVEEPLQAYSWLVLNDLSTWSFVDSFGMKGRSPEQLEAAGPDAVRAHFGGTLAPTLNLWLDGTRAGLSRSPSADLR